MCGFLFITIGSHETILGSLTLTHGSIILTIGNTISITILCVSRTLQRDACFHPQTQYSNSNSLLWATSHTRLRAHAQYCTSSTLIGGIGGAGPSSLHTLSLRDQWCMLMQDGCKVYMDHVSWSLELIFKNHFLEVGLTQNHETMTL